MRKVVVTGTDQGLGLGFVSVLLDKGYQVFAGCLSLENENLQRLMTQYPASLVLILLDISKDDQVIQAAQLVREKTDYLDLLINNAGILGDIEKTILDPLNFEEILQVINVNTLGPLRVTNALVELIRKGEQKCIVNISSEAGSIASNNREGWFGYTLSKAALNMEAALISQKLYTEGVRVLQIHPGWVRSYMHGTKNMEATYEPVEAASKIINVIEQQLSIEQNESQRTNQPIFIDLEGNTLPW